MDLHQHCRHVIHYDLGWNPAAVEQRTDRVDRLGSKTERERRRAVDGAASVLPRLEIGFPYVAGTYDERMFTVLRARAQFFEACMGGEFAVEGLVSRDAGQQEW